MEKEEKTLKEFVEIAIKEGGLIEHKTLFRDVLDVSSLVDKFEWLYGVELKVSVTPIKPREGRFFGKGAVDLMDTQD